MRKMSIATILFTMLAVLLLFQLASCGAVASTSVIETVVAETIAAITPVQDGNGEATKIVEVTKVKEITKIVTVAVSTTPKPTSKASATATASAVPSDTPTATPQIFSGEPTAVLTVEPSGIINETFNQFIARYKAMTDLQKQEYAASLPGKSVTWTAQVENVLEDGTVVLKAAYTGGTVILLNVPAETAIELDRKMMVDFAGMIVGFSGNISPEVTLNDVTIRRYYHLPTPTPTP